MAQQVYLTGDLVFLELLYYNDEYKSEQKQQTNKQKQKDQKRTEQPEKANKQSETKHLKHHHKSNRKKNCVYDTRTANTLLIYQIKVENKSIHLD